MGSFFLMLLPRKRVFAFFVQFTDFRINGWLSDSRNWPILLLTFKASLSPLLLIPGVLVRQLNSKKDPEQDVQVMKAGTEKCRESYAINGRTLRVPIHISGEHQPTAERITSEWTRPANQSRRDMMMRGQGRGWKLRTFDFYYILARLFPWRGRFAFTRLLGCFS